MASSTDRDRLIPLKQAKDIRVKKGDRDVRGWEVVASDGKTAGKVHDMLIDLRAGRVAYLDIELAKGIVQADRKVYVLAPIENARIVEDNKRVFMDGISTADFAQLPEYGHEPLTRDQEEFTRQKFDQIGSGDRAQARPDERPPEGGAPTGDNAPPPPEEPPPEDRPTG